MLYCAVKKEMRIQVAQGIKSLPSKFEDLSSVLGTLPVEGEN